VKISRWIFIYLFIHLALVSIFLALNNKSFHDNIGFFIQESSQKKEELFHLIYSLKTESIWKMAIDYTYWDDMVKFVKTENKSWATANLSMIPETFSIDAVWVYNPDAKPVYFDSVITNPDFRDVLQFIRIDPKSIISHFATNRMLELFIEQGGRFFQIFGITIHPTADAGRITPPAGYFFTAKEWDQEYLQEYKDALQFEIIELHPYQTPLSNRGFSADDPLLTGYMPLPGSGNPFEVMFRFNEGSLGEYRDRLIGQELLLQLFLIISYVFMFFFLLNRIAVPNRRISLALKNNSIQPVKDLLKSDSEFGDISRMIEKFLITTDELELTNTQLRLIEAHQRTMLDNIPFVVWLKDRENRFMDVNKEFEVFYKLKRNQILGKTNEEIFPKDVGLLYSKINNEMTKKQKKLSGRTSINFDGRIIYIEYFLSPVFDQKDDYIGLAGMFRDITDQTLNEEERSKLQNQINQINKIDTIGKMAGGVAHEFRNYLTIIKGYAELLLMRTDADPGDSQSLEQIVKAADNATVITSQLLAFSRKQIIRPQTMNLNVKLFELQAVIQRLLGENYQIKLLLDQDIKVISADPMQIEQIIFNLTLNSRDAMPHGGVITWKTRNAEIGEEYCKTYTYAVPGKYTAFSIIDYGTGMSEEVLKKIFDPFFTTKESGKGTGLGLSVVYGIVKQHNGWINVESAPGEGTSFELFFPVTHGVQNSAMANEERVAQVFRGNGEMILYLEDENGVRNLVADTLNSWNYHIIACPDIMTAREKYEENRKNIRLFISDILLPDGNGIEFAQEIQSDNPGLPVILTSGYADAAIRADQIESMNLDFIQKPFTLVELIKRIRGHLDLSETSSGE